MFFDEGKKYQDILDCALNIPVSSSMTKFSGKMMLMSKLADLFAGIGVFTDVLNKAKEEYDINIDSHVRYEYWLLNNEYWKEAEANIDKIVERYATNEDDRFDLPSMMDKYFPLPNVEKYANYKGADKELLTKQAYEEKKNKEHYRSVLSAFYDKRNMSPEELQKKLKASLYELRQILGEIANELDPNRLDIKKCEKLYDTLYDELCPSGDDFDVINEFYAYYNKWKDDGYGELQKDDYVSFIENEVVHLIESDFFVDDINHNNPRKRKEYEKVIDCSELETGLDKNTFYNRYVLLRALMNFVDGVYTLKSKAEAGRYIWKNRKKISRDGIKTFYGFICYNLYVASEKNTGTNPIEEEHVEELQSLDFYRNNDKGVFTQCNLYVVSRIMNLVDSYYSQGDWASLGNIENTLKPLLKNSDRHTDFVKQLKAWKIVDIEDAKVINAATGIAKRVTKINNNNLSDNDKSLLEKMKTLIE